MPTPVAWTNVTPTNADVTGVTLSKIAGGNDNPNAGATSDAAMTGDGSLKVTIPALGSIAVALSPQSSPTTYDQLHYWFDIQTDGTLLYRGFGVAYLGEDPYSAGAEVEIRRTGTTLAFYLNGVFVRNAPTPSSVPLYAHVMLWDEGDAVTAATLDAASAPPGEPTAPLTYDAVIDRLIRNPGPVPTLGPAGSFFIPADLGCPIHRATDANTGVGLGLPVGRSWGPNSAPNQCVFNSDTTKMVVRGGSGVNLILNLNPDADESIGQPVVLGADRTVGFGIEGAWSKTNPNLMYGTRYINSHEIEVYDFTANGGAGGFSTLLDLDSIDGTLTVNDYINSIYVSGGATPRLIAVYGGTQQNLHMKVIVMEIANPANRTIINVAANTIDGAPALDEAGAAFSFESTLIHSASIAISGNYVRIDPNWNSTLGFWLLNCATKRMKKVTTRTAGHYALGWESMVNEDQGAGPKPQWQERGLAFADAETVVARVTTPLSPIQTLWGDHTSWHNARTEADEDAPFFSSSQGWDPDGTIGANAWTDQILGVDPVGAERTYRFAYHRMIPYGDVNPNSNPSESYQVRGNVSQCGRLLSFKSNWGKTLGFDTAYATPLTENARYRTEAMVVRLGRVTPQTEPGNTPPTVSLTSPTSGSGAYIAPATIALAATAADADGTVVRVDFYAGATLIYSDTTGPYAFSWTDVPAGTYTLTARAYDDDGAETISAGVVVTVEAPEEDISDVEYGEAQRTYLQTARIAKKGKTRVNTQLYKGAAKRIVFTMPAGSNITDYTIKAKIRDSKGVLKATIDCNVLSALTFDMIVPSATSAGFTIEPHIYDAARTDVGSEEVLVPSSVITMELSSTLTTL